MHYNFNPFLFLMVPVFLCLSCQKAEEVFDEPYPSGKSPLGIEINTAQVPSPATGLPGIEVQIQATGLTTYREELIFRFNGEQAEIKEVNETGLTAIVPDYASSGVTSISVGDIIVFGPVFNVQGKINRDPTFQVTNGTSSVVLASTLLPDNKRIFVGDFTNYDNKGIVRPINRIVRTFPDGTYDASFRSGRGANGALNSVLQFQNRLIIAGGFSGYDQRTENISNVASLYTDGRIDTMGISTFRRPEQTDTVKYFSRFNGGFDVGVSALYEHQGKILSVGGFRYYVSRRYDQPNRYETRDTVILDSIEMRQIARLEADGSLDKTYRFNVATNSGYLGANGYLSPYLHQEGSNAGKLVLVGSFTRFDEQTTGYITRLNVNGEVDQSFNAGSGADRAISRITFNTVTRKFMISGEFESYDGQPVSRMAMLNEDGSLDPSFKPLGFQTTGGSPFLKQLDDGLIVVAGSFQTYGGITRNGFMILNPDGSLATGYNATGIFNGLLTDVIETRTEDNRRALLLIGSFWRFDNVPLNNIHRVVIE